MKVCLINSLYKPHARGGAEVIVENIARGLSHQGDHVFVISTGAKDDYEEVDDIKVYRLSPSNIFSFIDINKKPMILRLIWHIIDMFNFKTAKKVRKILKDENPDVVFTHNLMGLSYLIPRAIKKSGIKHIHTLHDVQLVVPSGLIIKNRESLTFIVRLYKNICRFLFSSPNIVISPSKWLLKFYEQRGFFKNSKKLNIANPIAKTESEFIEDSKSSKINFLFLGQVEEHKGVEYLIEVFKKLKRNDVRLRIAGAGKEVLEIAKKTKNNTLIEILGQVKREELVDIFSKSDALILPSLCYENSPAVIGEALSSGLPVIVSDIGGAAELVQDGVNGYKFKAGSYDSLLNILKSINKEKLNELKKQTKGSVGQYSLQHYLNKILALE